MDLKTIHTLFLEHGLSVMRFRGSCDMIMLQLTYEAPVFFFLLHGRLIHFVTITSTGLGVAVYKYRKLSSPAVYTYRTL